ncbi:MAG TPA: alanine dehydrogenase [Chloroflexota bacterium]|nr:alanine dehydrogenase [Chloroflexota bacterium]HZU06355.1 alanine dehydrogenase [Chloroflexota bacterium]
MRVGVPREIKVGERRVGLTPDGVAALRARGIEVLVEHGAGLGSGFTDEAYAAAGARLVERATVFGESELLVKVKEPVSDEPELLQPGQTLFCYLHLAGLPDLARRLLGRGLLAIAYEQVQRPDGSLPLLAPMSAIAGRLAVQVGATLLQSDHGGRGVLLGGVAGVPPATVVVLGAGTVGSHAVRTAVGLGARVIVVNRSTPRLEALDQLYAGRVETLVPAGERLAHVVQSADLLIGAVLVPGARAPVLVSRAMVEAMQPGSVIVDVAVDQGGCVATTRPTTHEAPTYVEAGVIHYAVPNMPALVPRTATLALTNSTLPYVLALATAGVPAALRADPALARGVVIWDDQVPSAPVAEALGLPAADLATLLAGPAPAR